jgi:hypothetical protein
MEFSFIYLVNLKFRDRRKENSFLLKIFILPLLGLCCPGRRHCSPHPGYAPRDLDSEEKRSADKNWMDDNVQDNITNGPRKEFESGSLSD